MTTRQSESNHASIYVLNGFYFCPKLPKNYNILPLEPLRIIIYNLMQGFLPQFIFQILLDWLLFLFLLEKVGGKTQSCFINKIHGNRQHLHIMRKTPWKALRVFHWLPETVTQILVSYCFSFAPLTLNSFYKRGRALRNITYVANFTTRSTRHFIIALCK